MSDLNKIATAINKQLHDSNFEGLLNQIGTYPSEEQAAVKEAVVMVKEAESKGEIAQQTPFSRLNMAHELVKAAAIQGNEEFQKEAAQAHAAGELAGRLLTAYVEQNTNA
jgi:acetylornithine deacetylase/succinyl-diaminopimelate desuccinylase-like protein